MTCARHLCRGEQFEGAAIIYRIGDTFLRCFDMDRHALHRQTNMYYPFANLGDWEMANFLLQSNLSMREIDSYLSLSMTKKMLLSFWTAKELRGHIEDLPKGPRWKIHIVPTHHPTTSPVELYWCDPLECIEALFNHPFYAGKMDYSPFCMFTAAGRIMRVYSEWMSSDGAWELQTQVPAGSMLCGVILSSDKTNITNVCGGKVVHPLLISLANIRMNVRNKASSHAFLLTTLMPIVEFIHPIPRIRSVLEVHLFHACLDFILEPLKKAAQLGQMMADPLRNICFCFTPLETLRQLGSICCDPDDIEAYFDACARFRLSGISHPFWRNWPLSDPHRFLTPECLHHWHRMSWDHDVKWCRCALGSGELDFCFSLLPPITGLRQFKSGITKLKQVGGCTQHDVQRYLVVDRSDGEVGYAADDADEAGEAVLNDLWAPKQSPSDFFDITAKHVASTALSSSPLCTFTHGSTAFHLNLHPSLCCLSVDSAAEKFAIPDLHSALGDFLALHSCHGRRIQPFGRTRQLAQDTPLPFTYLQIWYKVHIQQRDYHDRTSTALTYTIHAEPPNGHWKYGHYNAAILQVDEGHDWPDSRLMGHAVVEVHLIMRPHPPQGMNVAWANCFLVYVRWLDIINMELAMHLPMLKRAVRTSGSYFGNIFPLDQISSFAHVVPWFGKTADKRLTYMNACHASQSFYLNRYFDKDFFYATNR
ncbi:hypothetical protein PISMIDRAFT_111211 [Pisolithus microcarpus 441]|uniref:DUF6830 domain-containing protein n=1 Tax=Pisolithus microcarpus 441 TaxID=765257 RepID=A0A0C9YLK9_9AGAM|nr:hypothetical protein PISMIDRAFT_111211 [Pisolithus microcarpus 441]